MITKELISPKSIAIIGASEDTNKPGGNALKNLISSEFKGELFAVNPKNDNIQGIQCYHTVEDLPQTDLAILAIPAPACTQAVKTLCTKKGCRAVIIYSAGFGETNEEGAKYEKEIVKIANKAGATLIGPNCIGVMNTNYSGVFTKPIPQFTEKGVDIISGSGATVVFIIELAMQLGLRFSSVFSVGNSAQTGVEDILSYMDDTYEHGKSSPVKLIYAESIKQPEAFIKHASSLKKKGAYVVAIKSGSSEAGSRAASSHTGAMTTPETVVSAIFKKAGVIRCNGRNELATIAAVLSHPVPKGKRIAVITHAGGPAVMLTDTLTSGGMVMPHFEGEKADELLGKLGYGSSVGNPIDFLATGTAAQLEEIIDTCNLHFDVDSMVVIFGSPGLSGVEDVYNLVLKKQKSISKPIYAIFPSLVNASAEIKKFQSRGGISFPEEVLFGQALTKVNSNMQIPDDAVLPPVDYKIIRSIIDRSVNGYLSPQHTQKLLDAAGITRAVECVVYDVQDLKKCALDIGYPLVMKVVGPVHKTDVGGVVLNIADDETLEVEFNMMMKIPDTSAVLLQPMLTGTQLFIGAKREQKYGHVIMCGLGGIFIEAIGDISTGLSPVSMNEAENMIKSLKGYKILTGLRGSEGINISLFNEAIRRVSALCKAAPEIFEMDLNPLLGNQKNVIAVDARIRVEKNNIL
jgi:acetyltransferase